MQNYYQEGLHKMANQEIKDIIENGTMLIEFRFIDFAIKMNEIENKATKMNTYLSFKEKEDLLKKDYEKTIKLFD